jgi:hypothetical protein
VLTAQWDSKAEKTGKRRKENHSFKYQLLEEHLQEIDILNPQNMGIKELENGKQQIERKTPLY